LRFVPPDGFIADGLRVLLLPASGELIGEITDDIEEDATRAGIPLEAIAHFKSGIGLLVVADRDVSQVVRLLFEAGHVVSFPPGHEPGRDDVRRMPEPWPYASIAFIDVSG
jgi:hypothetical protein